MASNLDVILSKRPLPADSDSGELFDDEDDVGPCAAIAKHRAISALTIKQEGRPWVSFQYRHIGARSTFEPTRFELYFVGAETTWQLVVSGRNLEGIYNLCIQGRMEWLRASDRDFAGNGQPIITAIQVKETGSGPA